MNNRLIVSTKIITLPLYVIMNKQYDVLVVGAGLSGICMAYYLKQECANKSFAILEGREQMGGTWDLFRYPGIRSDSDMGTLGYRFREWKEAKQIADGPAIRNYIRDTAKENNLEKHIHYNQLVKKASWSNETKKWTVEVFNKTSNNLEIYTCSFYVSCSGYYNYEHGHTPAFKNKEAFQGQFIHPQHWPENLDYQNKKIVVIGSGATAVTLVPALVENNAAKVTMLQRSPSYYVSVPRVDPLAKLFTRVLPDKQALKGVRWKNFLFAHWFYKFSKAFPKASKRLLIKGVKRALPKHINIEKHFTPNYFPWDQRLCLVPDGDLFEALQKENCDIVTDHVDQFEPNGIRLKSGQLLEADIVVSATGLSIQVLGGVELTVNNKQVDLSKRYVYKSVMMSDVPNFAVILGYTNASWTLKADLAAEYIVRHINYMDKKGHQFSMPTYFGEPVRIPIMSDLTSNYIQRSASELPSMGDKKPWKAEQNYLKDIKILRREKIENVDLVFG